MARSDEEQKSRDVNEEGNIWSKIEKDYGVSKISISKKIKFVTDKFKRKIIFRDIEHAYILANRGFNKPAAILAGGVIEELLRLYLDDKKIKPKRDTFESYIEVCKDKELFKSAIQNLTESLRHFRNIAHLSREKYKKYTISKTTAKGSVSSIFTIINDL